MGGSQVSYCWCQLRWSRDRRLRPSSTTQLHQHHVLPGRHRDPLLQVRLIVRHVVNLKLNLNFTSI